MHDPGEQTPREREPRLPRTERDPDRYGDPDPDYDDGPGRTQQLRPTDDDWSSQQPRDPNWRQGRTSRMPRGGGRTSRGGGGGAAARLGTLTLPRSMQEFQQWFRRGGWQYVLAALLLLILIIFLFSWFSQSSRDATLRASAAATATAQAAQRQALQQPSVTPGAAPAAPAPGGEQGTFVVTGTATEGLFLRTQPRAPSEILTTLPEGTRVTAIGDEQDGPGPNGETLRWRQVRTEDNREGWVAASFLQPAP